jgi:hypothetical protein
MIDHVEQAAPSTQPPGSTEVSRRAYTEPTLKQIDVLSVLTKGGGPVQSGDNPIFGGPAS